MQKIDGLWSWKLLHENNCLVVVVVVIQFLSGVFPLAEMAGFTPGK